MIHHLQTTTSTNDDARSGRYRHGDVVWAEQQSAGRGQRGHVWQSREGENLTFSMVWEPVFLPAAEQFLICEAVALALTDTLAAYGIDTRIKWTNDIYAGDRKAVGILIEHNLSGGNLARTIVGIGLNVNQREFDAEIPNPVSMALLAGRDFDRRDVLDTLVGRLMARYAQLERGGKETLQADYHARMYRLGERHPYRLPDGTEFMAVMEGVRPTGELLLRRDDGSVAGYLFKEVEFVIPARNATR